MATRWLKKLSKIENFASKTVSVLFKLNRQVSQTSRTDLTTLGKEPDCPSTSNQLSRWSADIKSSAYHWTVCLTWAAVAAWWNTSQRKTRSLSRNKTGSHSKTLKLVEMQSKLWKGRSSHWRTSRSCTSSRCSWALTSKSKTILVICNGKTTGQRNRWHPPPPPSHTHFPPTNSEI